MPLNCGGLLGETGEGTEQGLVSGVEMLFTLINTITPKCLGLPYKLLDTYDQEHHAEHPLVACSRTRVHPTQLQLTKTKCKWHGFGC